MNTFTLAGNKLLCLSKSGKTYTIYRSSCSCPGFGFRKHCNHFDEAKKLGLLNKLPKEQTNILKSYFVVSLRKDALRLFFLKNNIQFTDKLISQIEPRLTIKTTPQEILKLVPQQLSLF